MTPGLEHEHVQAQIAHLMAQTAKVNKEIRWPSQPLPRCFYNMPTPEQIKQALANTLQKPRNHAPEIHQAIQNDKPAEAGLRCPVAGLHKQGACCGCCKV